jgi:hypothetical protein
LETEKLSAVLETNFAARILQARVQDQTATDAAVALVDRFEVDLGPRNRPPSGRE